MEAFGAQAVGSATGVASLFLISKLMLWWYRRRVSGLVVLKGKSTICKNLSNERLLFVDIDDYLEKMFRLIYPIPLVVFGIASKILLVTQKRLQFDVSKTYYHVSA